MEREEAKRVLRHGKKGKVKNESIKKWNLDILLFFALGLMSAEIRKEFSLKYSNINIFYPYMK